MNGTSRPVLATRIWRRAPAARNGRVKAAPRQTRSIQPYPTQARPSELEKPNLRWSWGCSLLNSGPSARSKIDVIMPPDGAEPVIGPGDGRVDDEGSAVPRERQGAAATMQRPR